MKKEPTTIQELRGMARYVNREFDNLCRDWKGRTWEEAHMNYSFEDYRKALEGAGPKLKELILDRAAHDPGIHLMVVFFKILYLNTNFSIAFATPFS